MANDTQLDDCEKLLNKYFNAADCTCDDGSCVTCILYDKFNNYYAKKYKCNQFRPERADARSGGSKPVTASEIGDLADSLMDHLKPGTSLSLLVIDLSTHCVIKVERGSPRGFEILTDAGFVNESDTKVFRKPFAAVRDAIDSQDKPVPRIERADVSGNERYRVVWNDSAYPIPVNVLDALSGVVGKPLPIYEPTEGKWTQLFPIDWTFGEAITPEVGECLKQMTDYNAKIPVTIHRYTRGGE